MITSFLAFLGVSYFAGTLSTFTVPLVMRGTPFQEREHEVLL